MRYQIADGISDDVLVCWLAWAANRAAYRKEVQRCGIV